VIGICIILSKCFLDSRHCKQNFNEFHFTEYVENSEYISVVEVDTKLIIIVLQLFKQLEHELNHHSFLIAEKYHAPCLLL